MRVEEQVHLYWVTVPDDPSEVWFVFATQALYRPLRWQRRHPHSLARNRPEDRLPDPRRPFSPGP
jgi:hypothetical protein